jgi:hypothetical protein
MALTQSQIDSAVLTYKNDPVGLSNYLKTNGATTEQVLAALAKFKGKSESIKTSSGNESKASYAGQPKSLSETYNITQSNTFQDGEVTKPIDVLSALSSNGLSLLNQMALTADEMFKQLALENQLRTEINEKIGISGALSQGLRQEMLDSYPAAIRFGYGISQISEMVSTMMTKSGRFNMISSETLNNTFSTARAFVGSLEEMGTAFTEFEQIGIGAGNAIDEINKAGQGSLALGLVAKGTIKDIRENIGKINEFGFKNGVQGLAEMSRQSKEFRINMSEAFKLADKVMDPANAIDMVANLQVIGGAFGDLNDPLKLMYDATNNVESLQDSLIKAASGLATYNQEQGRFEILGINQRRVRDMAAAMGVDYRELTKSAIASQERMLANNDLMAKGFNIPEKDKEFITNLSKMDNGKMVIEIPKSLSSEFEGKSKIALEDLTQSQIEVLEKNRDQLEKMNPEDIARDQVNSVMNIERDVAAMFELQKIEAALTVKGSGTNELGLNSLAAKAEATVSTLTDQLLKDKTGPFSEKNKEKIAEAVNTIKTNPIVSEYLNKLKVMADAYGDTNPKIKERYEKIMKSFEKIEKGELPNSSNGQTKNITFKHEFSPIPAFVDALGSSIVKNPNTFNEWAERNSNEFTTPNVAKK